MNENWLNDVFALFGEPNELIECDDGFIMNFDITNEEE